MLRTRVHEYFDTYSEKEMQQKLLALLESKNWDVRRAAKQMGVSAPTLWRILSARPNLARARIKARAQLALDKYT